MSSLTSLSLQNQGEHLNLGDKDLVCGQLHTYSHRLIGLARKHLKSKTGTFIDPEDVVQSVFKSIITRLDRDPSWLTIENPGGLFALLAAITVRKCWRKSKKLGSQATLTIDDLNGIIADENEALEEAIVKETIDYLLYDLNEAEIEVARRLILEQSVNEIARELEHTNFYVNAVRKLMRERLDRLVRIDIRAEGD